MLTCRQVTEQASEFLDGQMGWRKQLQLRLHMLMCRHCSRYLGQLGSTVRLVRSMPREQPEPEIEHRLESAFRAQFGKVPDPEQPSRSTARSFRPDSL